MKTSVNSLYIDMQRELESASKEQTNLIKSTIESIKIVRSYLEALKKQLIDKPFKDCEEEVIFFKIEKPMFEKHLQYEIRRHALEIIKTEHGKEALEKQIRKEYKQIESDFIKHQEFYYYYKSGSTFMDAQLFTREDASNIIFPEYAMMIEPEFSTMHSYLIARIEANELMRNYLETFNSAASVGNTIVSNVQSAIRWTASKTDCVEFIYGLYANGCLNNGRLDIKSIALFIQRTFDIDLGNIYRIFQDIRIRDERTKYHNKTVTNLVSLMDYSDENPRFT